MNKVVTHIGDIGLKKFSGGKVRELFDLGDRLLIVATDRISAFDIVMKEGIPGKGAALTSVSSEWFRFISEEQATHFISTDLTGLELSTSLFELLNGRSMIVKKAEPLPVECIVRGYLAGSAWKEYQINGTINGIPMPEGLVEAERFEEPIFTPSTKSKTGHDENISFDELSEKIGEHSARELKRKSLEIFRICSSRAEERGLIIADTKFEFGFTDEGLILIDELLTPDSSRFWLASSYKPGRSQDGLDKQFLRDFLENSGWKKEPPPPRLPEHVILETAKRYELIRDMLTA